MRMTTTLPSMLSSCIDTRVNRRIKLAPSSRLDSLRTGPFTFQASCTKPIKKRCPMCRLLKSRSCRLFAWMQST